MKKLFVLTALAIAATGGAQAQVLFDNGAAVVGTPPISVIRTGGSLFGAGAQTTVGNVVADDFMVTGPGWNVASFSFFAYQTNATTFGFTGATWSIVSGDVTSGTVVASGASSPVTNGGFLGYRVTETTLTNTARAIYQVNVDVPDFTLAAGSYWLRWNLAGNAAFSGPWQPPTAAGTIGNGQQALAGAAFASIVDAGDTLGVELPFVIQGSVVPEPSTYAMLLAGGLGVLVAARRRRQG